MGNLDVDVGDDAVAAVPQHDIGSTQGLAHHIDLVGAQDENIRDIRVAHREFFHRRLHLDDLGLVQGYRNKLTGSDFPD